MTAGPFIDKLHTKVLPYCWIFIFPPAAVLSLELTYEKTYLSWIHGTQILGYVFSSLFPPIVIICMVAVLLCYVWIGLFTATAILTQSLPPKPQLIRILLTVSVLGLERIPIGLWQALLSLFLGQPDYGYP